ncbi:MFS transporter [Allostella vacuolata]|nr:MFS transporter [Stella vacuolata]
MSVSVALPAPPPPSLLSIAALLLSVTFLVFGTSLQGLLLPVRGRIEEMPPELIGLLSSSWSVGFVLACILAAQIVSRVGHIRSFAALAAISGSAALLLLPLAGSLGWVALRFLIGFCYGGLVMIIESWLNERATPERRGTIFASYMIVNLMAALGGNLSLVLLDPRTEAPFIAMVIAIVLSLVPLALTRSPAPPPVGHHVPDLPRLYRLSPVGVLGCFLVGLVNGALGGLVAVYALGRGLSVEGVAMMAAASVVGGALAYYPIGKLSDRMDRRRVIVAVAGCGIVIGGLIVVLPAGLPAEWLILLFGLFGLAQHPIYGLCIAHANDHAGGQSFTQTTSELLLTYGLGTIAGPVAAAVTMRALGDASLFLFTSCVYGTLILFTLWRMRTRLAPPAEQKTDVAPLAMVPTTPEAHALDPRDGALAAEQPAG